MRRQALASVSIAAMAALTPLAALAQDEAGEGARLEEIVVTAQKREQRLQDVPVAITAVSAETIQANRITTVRDLSALAPNLLVRTQPGGGSNPGYTMRGYVNTGSAAGTDRGVALYVDGVYLGNPNGSIFELAEIQRVEVLRGPQGTLFGRNSTAGAINFITAEPHADFGVKVTATVGNYDHKRIRAVLNTGQMGMFSASIAASHAERRGDVRNLGFGTTWNFTPAFNGKPTFYTSPRYLGGFDQDSIALTVKFEPTDNFKNVYRYDWNENNYTGEAFGSIYQQPIIRGMLVGQNQALMTQISRSRPDAVNNSNSVPGYAKAWGHSLTSEYQFSDSLSVKNIFANRRSYYLSPWSDFGALGGVVNNGSAGFAALLGAAVNAQSIGAPFVLQGASTGADDTQWSDEFQINYNSKLVTLTTGALYYSQTQRRFQAGVDAGIGRARSPSRGVYPGFVVPQTLQPGLAGGRLSKVKVKSKAVYGQAEIHVLDNLDLVGGVRYTDDRKFGIDASTVSLAAPRPNVIDYKGDKVTYNLGVNYKITPDILLYGKYSTGYISGGAISAIVYNPEVAKSWEGGVKADWLNGTLRTNLTAFSTKYTDLQASVSGTLLGRPEITNAIASFGDAKVEGVELETSWSPMRNLVFTANGGYLDFEYTRLSAIATTGVAEVMPIYRPKWTGNVSAQYTTEPLFGDASLTARVDGSYRSKQWGISSVPVTSAPLGFTAAEQAIFREQGKIKGYWLWNARVALQDINLGQAKGTLALWGRNLANNKSPTLMQSVVLVISTSYEPARTVGLDFTVEF